MTAQRHTNRGGRDLHTKPVELALDTLVAPAWVLPGQTDDQLLDLLIQWRSSRSTRLGPGAGDQPPMPTQQRVGLDEEARPTGSGEDAADRGEQGAVSRL